MAVFAWGHRRHGSIRLTDAAVEDFLGTGTGVHQVSGDLEVPVLEDSVRGDEWNVEVEEDIRTSRKQLALIYSLQLAEAYVTIMCASLVVGRAVMLIGF